MLSSRIAMVTGCLVGIAAMSSAQTVASATLSYAGSQAGFNDYSITLNNLGTTPIGTFWYSWVPGQDYMSTVPQDFTEPSAFGAPIVTNGGVGDGYAIRWESTTGIAAGSSGVFTFESQSTLAQLAGNSAFHSHPPVGTAFVYSGEFSGTSDHFVVQTVPTPPGALALGVGLLGLAIRSRRKRR